MRKYHRDKQIQDTYVPHVPQSTFNLSHSRKSTFNAGKLVPILVEEVLPGDVFNIDTTALIRTMPLVVPSMDRAQAHISFFFVPNRIIWEEWKRFMGENKNTTWYEKDLKVEVPTINFTTPIKEGTLADHLGLPVGKILGKVNHLPFRAYIEIYNEWFKDQNVQNPLINFKDSAVLPGKATNFAATGTVVFNSKLPNVNKDKDYFTSCLPSPQKGDDVLLGMLGVGSGALDKTQIPIKIKDGKKLEIDNVKFDGDYKRPYNDLTVYHDSNTKTLAAQKGSIQNMLDTLTATDVKNLDADATQLFSELTLNVNQLRKALAQQKHLELDAIGGTRYIEKVFTHFGVRSSDARVNRPELLGISVVDVDQSEVAQTSSTSSTSPQGHIAGFSKTQAHKPGFEREFSEHGFIIGMVTVKTEQTYQYGIKKFWKQKDRLDYYFPEFAHLGEQPVYNWEIFQSGVEKTDNGVFGYQSAWAHLKYPISGVAGLFNSTAATSLDIYHYAPKFEDTPTLNEDFIRQRADEIDRTLAVKSGTNDQFLADFYFQIKATRKLPVHSVPQLKG